MALFVLLAVRMVLAQTLPPPLMPHRPLLRGFGGLCDGGPLVCTRIDQIAFHAGADSTLLPSTRLRGLGFVASYGFSIGILQHIEGGIFSNTAVWGQPSQTGGNQPDTLWQQGPMRFALKGLLWPFTKNPHQHLAILADFEYEVRWPHFDGQNQLGLLSDLAALRAVGNLPLGLAEVGLAAGALWDGAGTYATPELGARVGFHLPFLTDTKVFAEGVARGLGGWMKARIVPSGALALGLVIRPRRQVAFSMVAHVGFGDVAPFFLTLRGPLDFSIGEGYPYPQSLVVDILREAGEWVAEQLHKLPESFQQTCLLYGRDDQLIAALGHLTEDSAHCEFQGQRFRIGDTLYPDPVHRRVCTDPEATHCVGAPYSADLSPADAGTSPSASPELIPTSLPQARHLDPAVLKRLLNQGALGPIQGSLDGRCILNEGDHQVSPIGHLATDGKHCVVERNVNIIKNGKKLQTKVQQVPIPIGKPVYRDPTTGRVCLSQKTKSNKDCPTVLDVEHNRPLASATEAGYHGALALVDWTRETVKAAQGVTHTLTHPAELTTAGLKAKDRAVQAAKRAVVTLQDPKAAQKAAHAAWDSTIDAAHGAWVGAVNFYDLPPQKKLDHMAEAGVKGSLDIGATAVVGAVLPGAGLTVAEDIAQAGEKIVGQAASHIDEAAARSLLLDGEKRAAKEAAVRSGSYTPNRALPTDKKGVPIPDSPNPHTQLGRSKPKYGSEPQAREWGEGSNGTLAPKRDIDFTDHGTPDIHPNPHQHTLTPNNSALAPQGGFKRGPAEPL